jgi:hypothetical protein
MLLNGHVVQMVLMEVPVEVEVMELMDLKVEKEDMFK